MKSASGVVQVVFEKKGKSKSGKPYSTFSIKLDDDNWYSCKFTEPACKKGDEVEFEYVWNPDYKSREVDLDTLQVMSEGNGGNEEHEDEEEDEAPPKKKAPSKAPVKKAAPAAKGGKDGYWEGKDAHDKEIVQPRISFSWATTLAVQALQVFQAAGGEIAIGTVKKRQLGTFINELELLRDRFLQQAMNPEYVNAAIAGKGKTEEKAKAQESDTEGESTDE